jgi:hypothetical protein
MDMGYVVETRWILVSGVDRIDEQANYYAEKCRFMLIRQE